MADSEYVPRYEVYSLLKNLSQDAIIEIVRLYNSAAVSFKSIHNVFGGAKRDEWLIWDDLTKEIYSATTSTELEAWQSALKRVTEKI